MATITNEMIHASYDVAKQIHDGGMSHKDGLDVLESKYQMNRNSASDYVHNYICMIEGRRFSRTSTAYGTQYYLQRFYEDGGRNLLLNALSALRQHIDYYEVIGNTKVRTRKAIYERFVEIAEVDTEEVFPDEVSEDEALREGKTRQVNVNIYERNPIARQQCIEHYGCECFVCGFDFEKTYGQLGKSFIHVHHMREISSVGSEYSVNPIEDLRPVCPNCHAMIHRKRPAYSIEEVKKRLTIGPS